MKVWQFAAIIGVFTLSAMFPALFMILGVVMLVRGLLMVSRR